MISRIDTSLTSLSGAVTGLQLAFDQASKPPSRHDVERWLAELNKITVPLNRLRRGLQNRRDDTAGNGESR